MLLLYIVVASFTTLQLFSAYKFGKGSKNQLIHNYITVLYNISVYHDAKAVIYQYTQIVYRLLSMVVVHA